MLDKRMEEALNKQINAEFYSAYLYLSMAAQFDALGLKGGANWMNVQFQEETAHAMKFFAYVTERGGRVQLEAIEKPQTEWPSALAMFEHALQHEQKVTGMIDALADLALELKDHATHNLLQWFIAEQVEEEANASEMVQKLTLAKDSPAALFNIDRDMAARVFVPPTATA